MGDTVTWLEGPPPNDGAFERSFQMLRPRGPVPGVLWLPARHATPGPIVLLGHGGSGHKRSNRIVRLGRWFASRAGIAAVAIDGPFHGDRVASVLSPAEYQRRMAAEGLDVVIERMVDDWRATIDVVRSLDGVDGTSLGYLGLSMGTRFGLPLGAALGEDLRCAVLGKFGLQTATGFYSGMEPTARIRRDASQVTAATLFHVQWDDELFARDGQFDLFDALRSPDKELIAYPGMHGETRPQAVATWCAFIARHLGYPSTGAGASSVSETPAVGTPGR